MPCIVAKTRNPLKFAGVPQTTGPISAISRPKFTILWEHLEEILLLNKFFPIVDMCLSCEDITRQSCTMVRRWRLFGDFLPLGMEVGDIVLDGDPAPPSPKGAQPPPQFSANVRCGQTAEWTKIPLGMEVGHGPGDFVFNGDPAPPRKKGKAPLHFWLVSIVAKWLDGSRCHLVRR